MSYCPSFRLESLKKKFFYKSYKELTNLITIDFTTTKFTTEANIVQSIDPNTFKGLAKLNSITFNANQIAKLDADTFENVPNLIRISFSNNQITELDPMLFKNLTKLE